MDKKLKAKWLKALRSGKYKQGMELLKFEGDNKQTRFCCLGVLCDVGHIRSTSSAVIKGKNGDYRILPQNVQQTLTEMNDGGKRFTTIATYIEKNL